jgi:phenylacetate-CoA ligase
MRQRNIERYIAKINSYQPELIRGYATSLFEVCRYAASNSLLLYSPKAVVSSAETLSDEMREVIESGFNTKVYDFYGSREAPCLAGECSEGSMHIFSFLHHLEVLNDDNQAVKNGEEGRIVVTSLHNYSMPLIRYEIGDTAIQGGGPCSCDNMLPTLSKVTGRIVDHFVIHNGTTVPAEFFIHLIGVVCHTGAIKKFQVIQEDYRKIRILVVLQSELPKSYREDVGSKIRKAMGNCDIVWDTVDDIPKSPSGKYSYTRSLVHKKAN